MTSLLIGFIFKLVTFPGVMLHEFAHKKFCDWFGVKVLKVVYFQPLGSTAGYVLHEEPSTLAQTFWISVGPLLINSITTIILSFILTFLDKLPGARGSGGIGTLVLSLLWLAFSFGCHAFPSDQDASHVLIKSREKIKSGGSIFHYIAYPFFGFIWVANILRFFWFDAIYALILIYLGGFFR